MTFESWVVAFADRFLSDRTCQLVVAPALADLQFDEELGRRSRLANRLAVLRAVAGGLRDEMSRDAGTVCKMTLLSACYYTFPLFVGIRAFTTWIDFFTVLSVVLALSLVPVMVCMWPARPTTRPVE